MLFETSGAANAGIDNPNIYGVLRSEMPPSLEECVQEQGRAGRRPGSNATTDLYTICISFESLLVLLKRIYKVTVDKIPYRESLLLDLKVTLDNIVLPTHCLLSIFAGRCSNPFDTNQDNCNIYHTRVLHPVLFVMVNMTSYFQRLFGVECVK